MSDGCLTSGCSNYLTGSLGHAFASSLQLIFAAQCMVTENWPEDGSSKLEDLNFDYIVIGAGSAGSVVASRLSEDACRRVLLVEAGGDPPFESLIISGSPNMVGTKYDWQYKSVRDGRTCKSHDEGRCHWPSGKMLGGSSSINAMVYTRGHFKNFDDMEAAGNIGWNSEIVLEYYKKSEHLHDKDLQNDLYYRDYHNYDGLLGIRRFNGTTDPLKGYLKKAFAEIGLGEVKDIGDLKNHGTVEILATIEDDKRESAARAFLVPARDRNNLVILKNTLATKILFKDKTATGVVLKMRDGKEITVNAAIEVIVSAGTIKTPQLLMLSGIGPADHLKEMNIDIVADLAVGENLHDHVTIPIILTIDDIMLDDSPEKNVLDMVNYLMYRKGPFAENNIFELITYVHLNGQDKSHPPQIQYQHAHFPKNSSSIKGFLKSHYGLNDVVISSIKEINEGKEVIVVFNDLLDTKSKGHIKLASTDPEELPAIHTQYFSENEDIETLIKGANIIQTLLNTQTMKKLGAKMHKVDIPECDIYKFTSDDYWRCAIMNIGFSIFHHTGTSKMGPATDPKAVVDPELKVHGIKNLRAVDASIFPSTLSCNTNAPAMMVGERGADFIKKDNRHNGIC